MSDLNIWHSSQASQGQDQNLVRSCSGQRGLSAALLSANWLTSRKSDYYADPLESSWIRWQRPGDWNPRGDNIQPSDWHTVYSRGHYFWFITQPIGTQRWWFPTQCIVLATTSTYYTFLYTIYICLNLPHGTWCNFLKIASLRGFIFSFLAMFSFPVLALAFSWAGSYARLWRCAVGQVVAKAGCALSKTQNTNIKHKHMKSETKYKTHPGYDRWWWWCVCWSGRG